jgi:hypothetical protein
MIKKTLSMKKSTKQKETQVVNIETLAKIILIYTINAFIVENESLLNKKSKSHKK